MLLTSARAVLNQAGLELPLHDVFTQTFRPATLYIPGFTLLFLLMHLSSDY